MKIKTTEDVQKTDADHVFKYQPLLTPKLDKLDSDFDQNNINEIILWKVNRYAEVPEAVLELINALPNELDEAKTRRVLEKLLPIPGIRLAMASTILKFKKPNIYQIIDQRVYRIIYGKTLNLSTSQSAKVIGAQIDLYLEYLVKLREVSKRFKIDFHEADRVLYNMDKRANKDIKIKY